MGDGTRPTTEHAAQILGIFWEDSITPSDLMSRSLAAGRASADAFQAASEGSAAAIRLGLSGTGLFVERASGTWFQSFLPFVQAGETFSQIALTFANMSRALAETNVAQAEVVYQAETEIQAVRTQASALGQDPTPAINAILADAQARVSALSANCVANVGGTGGAGGYNFTSSTGAPPSGGATPSPITNSVGDPGRGPEFTTSTKETPTEPNTPISNTAGGDAKPPSGRIVDAGGQTPLIGGGGSGGGGGTPGGLSSTPGGANLSGISTQGVSSPSSPLSPSGLGGAPSQAAPSAGQISPASNVTGPSASPTDGAASTTGGAPSSPSAPASSNASGVAGSPGAQTADAPTAATSTGTSQPTTGFGATPLLAAGGVSGGAVAPAAGVAPTAASVGASAPAVPASAMSAAATAAQAAASAPAAPTVSAPASAMPTLATATTPPMASGQQVAAAVGAQPTIPTPQASSPSVSVPTSPPAPQTGQGSSAPETPDPILQLVPLGIVPVVAWQDLADTPRRLTPEGKLVYNVLASILGSLHGGPHGPDSGLDWAVALLTPDEGYAQLAITTRDAGWLPPGVVIPRGARVAWNVPTAVPWATVDDPVRQLLEHARNTGHAVRAIATTHPSRAYADGAGTDGLIGVAKPGPVLPDGLSRLEAIASPGRFARIARMSPEEAARQTRALLRDLERITETPLHADHSKTRADIRRFLEARKDVPAALTDQLQRDLDATSDALASHRIDPRGVEIGDPAPPSDLLCRVLIDQSILHAVAAAVNQDVESAVYAWTVARYLST